jgi:hypothetical protein
LSTSRIASRGLILIQQQEILEVIHLIAEKIAINEIRKFPTIERPKSLHSKCSLKTQKNE